MANLKSKTLFFTTSPRTPTKMIPEIQLIKEKFTGKVWNEKTQIEFMDELISDENFQVQGPLKDKAFSARDRITRAPKALGFIDLKPVIKITDAGTNFINDKRTEEALLRQLIKFQLPSPYHVETANITGLFWSKPYLEILRMIHSLGTVTFDELMIFGMQLTNYKNFEKIISKIKSFRINSKDKSLNYKKYFNDCCNNEISNLYSDEIISGNTETRESSDTSVRNFINTKKSNLHDYADACFRYLRATGVVSISHHGKSLSIMPDKMKEIEFLLTTVDRNPVYVHDEEQYKDYLFNESLPVLFSDDKHNLIDTIMRMSSLSKSQINSKSILELKDLRGELANNNKNNKVVEQIKILKTKSYALYSEIIDTYNQILSDELYDAPLMLEWNTWKAMTMINGGKITGNFKIDDNGQPMSTAQGNKADIVCDYGDFGLIVEVTMQRGQRQYETEGEPVSRHLAKYKEEIKKDAYCLFIAPHINNACIAHFYALHNMNISYYGGKSVILPIDLDIFMKMIENSYTENYIPSPKQIKSLFEYSTQIAKSSIQDEIKWYDLIQEKARQWPNI